MDKLNRLDQLGPITEEMLAGLHADDKMKLRIRMAAAEGRAPARRRMNLAPAVCCAALALVVAGAAGTRLTGEKPGEEPVQIMTIAAGGGETVGARMIADLGDGAKVRMAADAGDSLFESAAGDIAMLSVDGAVYRMLASPQDMGAGIAGKKIGVIAAYEEQPSLASAQAIEDGLSNVAQQGAAVYAVSGLDTSTAVCAQVDGKMRLFQRVSYAGKGPGSQTLEDTFCVRGKVKSLELTGVGRLTGEDANRVAAVLLDCAVLTSADASARGSYLTVTLSSGLKLQLGVSGDMLCGCGGWSCPEFFEAFEAAL